MAVITVEQAMQSLGTSLLLQLAGYNPETEFTSLSLFGGVGGRRYVTYQGQRFTFMVGGLTLTLLSGISIELGTAEITDHRHSLPIIISVTREIIAEPELEQQYLAEMGQRLDPLIKTKQSCPIFAYDVDGNPTSILATVRWNDKAYHQSVIQRPLIGSGLDGWYRMEYEATMHFVAKVDVVSPKIDPLTGLPI